MARQGVALDPMLTDPRALATGTSGRWDDDPRWADLPAATKASWRRQAAGQLFSPGNSMRAEAALATVRPVIGELHRRGVVMLAGTGAGSPFDFPGSDIHSELALLVDAGLTPLDALRAATLNPSVFMGMADSLGVIEPGMVADLVLDVLLPRLIGSGAFAGRYRRHHDVLSSRHGRSGGDGAPPGDCGAAGSHSVLGPESDWRPQRRGRTGGPCSSPCAA